MWFRRAPCVAVWVWLFAALGVPEVALAKEKQHRVRPGQTLGGIADRYGVTKWSVAGLNGLDPETLLKTGDVVLIPARHVVYINPGQTLWSVARRHHLTVARLAKLNGLPEDAVLMPGQRLVLPGYRATRAERTGWGKPKQPGRVQLHRIAHREKLTLTLVDGRGRVRAPAIRQMARFMRPRGGGRTRHPSRRLLAVLAQISDHFGGRRIDVISGYRTAGGYTAAASRHVAGAAVDIRIKGVPNAVLRDYCRALSRVGCGYYPNSTFVHVDVRTHSAYWIDVSRPGQRPEYVDPKDFQPDRRVAARHIDGDREPADAQVAPSTEDEPAAKQTKAPRPTTGRAKNAPPLPKVAAPATQKAPAL